MINERNELKLSGIKVQYLNAQCGMNFISNLGYATTTKDQIHVLDYAFNSWGSGYSLSTDGVKDMKSQVFFTDTVEMENKRWPEIKKICHRGPVTPNARYKVGNSQRRNITIYILTRGDYYQWREKWLADHPEDDPEKKNNEDKKNEQAPEAVPQPSQDRIPTASDRRRGLFMNFNLNR